MSSIFSKWIPGSSKLKSLDQSRHSGRVIMSSSIIKHNAKPKSPSFSFTFKDNQGIFHFLWYLLLLSPPSVLSSLPLISYCSSISTKSLFPSFPPWCHRPSFSGYSSLVYALISKPWLQSLEKLVHIEYILNLIKYKEMAEKQLHISAIPAHKFLVRIVFKIVIIGMKSYRQKHLTL